MQNTDLIIKELYTRSYELEQTGKLDLSLPTNRLILIGTKVLDNRSNGPINFDVDRLYDELVYFNSYGSKDDRCPLSFFLGIILANRSYQAYESYMIDLINKLMTFYTTPESLDNYIIEVFILDSLIRAYIRSGEPSQEGDRVQIFKDIKDKLVSYNLIKESKKETIGFQLKKIKYIEKVHRLIDHLEGLDGFKYDLESPDLLDLLGALVDGNIGKDSLSGLLAILLGYDKNDSNLERQGQESETFVLSMADYLVDLRNRKKISRKYQVKSSPRHFLKEEVGYQAKDPILNRYRIVDKLRDGNTYIVRLETKSGPYNMTYTIKD